MSALSQALATVQTTDKNVLVTATDRRKTLAASTQELDYGDGAAALLVGKENVLAEFLASATITDDFVDHFRASSAETDYHWEERWIRDEGVAKIVPEAVKAALGNAGLGGATIDHFIFPTTLRGVESQVAKACGINPEAIVNNLAAQVGDTGVPHGLLMLAGVLETAKPGALICLAQFGQGAEALVFRVTDAITRFKPVRGLAGWLGRGIEETHYTKFLAFNEQLNIDKGMRAEADKKTALSTAYRHKEALLGLVAGRCRETGNVHFPPTRLSYDVQNPLQDTQEPYKLAEREATVLSWSADMLSFSMSPPHYYGNVDFDGGGRLMVEFADVAVGEIEAGAKVEMTFRIKDVDSQRHFRRYFWKATPVHT